MRTKFFSKKQTIRNLKRINLWRLGKIEEYSKTERVPDPKMTTKTIDSAIHYLENNEEEETWVPTTQTAVHCRSTRKK